MKKIFFLFFILTALSCKTVYMTKPFLDSEVPKAPDYSNLNSWIAQPKIQDTILSNFYPENIDKLKADVFYIYPTLITDKKNNDELDINVEVEEKSTGEIMAGAGFGTEGTQLMFSVSENNWLGRGVQLQTAVNASQDKISGNILINNPNYNFTGNSVSASLDVSEIDKTATSGFKTSKTGVGLGTSFEQYEDIYFSPSIDILHENIETESSASDRLKKMDGDYFNSNFTYGITIDKRNQSWQPTEGYKVGFSQSLPLIQDSSSILNGIDVSAYHGFSEDLIGSLKIYVRTINGIDSDVRLTNRLYIPRNKLRGFNTYRVGPKDGEDWIGGNYVTALSAEAQLPNLLPESYRTDFNLFLAFSMIKS